MNCEIIKDLIPLYIDGCCSEESSEAVKNHVENCCECSKLIEEMKAPADIVAVSEAPKRFSKINDWKASVLQSVLFFISFGLIAIGVACESATAYDNPSNGLYAANLAVPATGFLISLTNWYFVRIYKNRKVFSNCSAIITFGITICGFVWSFFHYTNYVELFEEFSGYNSADVLAVFLCICFLGGIGILLTFIFCVLSKILSNKYAEMLGKE